MPHRGWTIPSRTLGTLEAALAPQTSFPRSAGKLVHGNDRNIALPTPHLLGVRRIPSSPARPLCQVAQFLCMNTLRETLGAVCRWRLGA